MKRNDLKRTASKRPLRASVTAESAIVISLLVLLLFGAVTVLLWERDRVCLQSEVLSGSLSHTVEAAHTKPLLGGRFRLEKDRGRWTGQWDPPYTFLPSVRFQRADEDSAPAESVCVRWLSIAPQLMEKLAEAPDRETPEKDGTQGVKDRRMDERSPEHTEDAADVGR